MAANFKIGQIVKVIAVIPEGPVDQISVDQEGNITYLVTWTDINGVLQQSWFVESTLEAA
jgi:hypothetical protein